MPPKIVQFKPKPPTTPPTTIKVKRVVTVTAAQDKLFWFVFGVFCGANWIAAMGALIRWMATPP